MPSNSPSPGYDLDRPRQFKPETSTQITNWSPSNTRVFSRPRYRSVLSWTAVIFISFPGLTVFPEVPMFLAPRATPRTLRRSRGRRRNPERSSSGRLRYAPHHGSGSNQEIGVSEVVLVCTPFNLKVWKYVFAVNCKHGVRSEFDIRSSGLISRRLLTAVVVPDRGWIRRAASSLLGYSARSTSTPFFLIKGRDTGIRPRDMARFTALSGSRNVCVGRLWQSTHCME